MGKDTNGSGPVTNRQLYETLKDFPTRRELRLTIGLGVVGGNAVAQLITAYITHLSPPQQAAAVGRFVTSLFS